MPRAMANTVLAFGPFVNIPVQLFSATDDSGVRFHSYHVHGEGDVSRISMPRVCQSCDETVEQNELTRGVERDDNVILVTDDELAQVEVDSGREFEILHFVDADEISPMLYESPYFLAPDLGGSKRPMRGKGTVEAYVTLRTVLEDTGRVGVVKYTMRGKTHLAVLRVEGEVLVIQNVLWPSLLRKPEFASLDREVAVDPQAVKLMTKLVEDMVETFSENEYVDTYAERVKELLDAKESGVPMAKRESDPVAEVSDLLEALKKQAALRAKSQAAHPAGKRAPAKAPAKKAAAKAAPRKAAPAAKAPAKRARKSA